MPEKPAKDRKRAKEQIEEPALQEKKRAALGEAKTLREKISRDTAESYKLVREDRDTR